MHGIRGPESQFYVVYHAKDRIMNVPVALRSIQVGQNHVPAFPCPESSQSGGDHSNVREPCVIPPRQVLPYVLPVSPPISTQMRELRVSDRVGP
jgi:hypothetical protein